MTFRFASPLFLLLLLALPIILHASLRLKYIRKWRRYVSVGLRLIIFLSLVLAAAELESVKKLDALTVFFVLDRSDSVPVPLRDYAQDYVNRAVESMAEEDLAGVIVFGTDSSIESLPSNDLRLLRVDSHVSSHHTDLAGAIRLAQAAFPENMQRRIVILSDGNENIGDAIAEARAATADKTRIDVVPLSYEAPAEIMVEELVVPSRVEEKEPFDVKIVVRASREGPAHLRLFQEGHLVAEQELDLTPGKHVFVFTSQVDQARFVEFEARIDSELDTFTDNNRQHAFAVVRGEPRVLYVEGQNDRSETILAALSQENIQVDIVTPYQMPQNPADIQDYDTIILSNVFSSDLSERQMKVVEVSVKDSGLGLIMIGGEDAFGAGGYEGTPIEDALPVNMDLKQRKVIPQGALAIVLHTVEIPNGNAWARDITLAAVDVLSSRDLFGVLDYDWQKGEEWAIPLQPVGNKQHIQSILNNLRNGDMPSFDPTLQMAYDALSASSAAIKHIVVISDGDPSPPTPALIKKIQDARITISTVVIAAHPNMPQSKQVMQWLAGMGGGNFYDVIDFASLPRIFSKEAAIIKKSLIREETFKPAIVSYSEVLKGIAAEDVPVLHGYVRAAPKDMAEVPMISDEDDPILAHWQYGLGKSLAFTSDAMPRWAADWVGWENYAKFWSQAVRYVQRSLSDTNFQTTTRIEGGKGTLMVDAVDDTGRFINELDLSGTLLNPEIESLPLEFRQVAPGRYAADFPATEIGSYVANLSFETLAGQTGQFTAGLAISYSPEYKTFRANESFLARLAEETGGRNLRETQTNATAASVFDHDLQGVARPFPLWMILLGTAVVLFPLDVFVRRVTIEWKRVWAFAHSIMARIPVLNWIVRPVAEPGEAPAMSRLMAVIERARSTGQAREAVEVAAQAPTAQEELEGRPGGDILTAESALEPDVAPAPSRVKEGAGPKEETYTGKLLEAKKRARKKF